MNPTFSNSCMFVVNCRFNNWTSSFLHTIKSIETVKNINTYPGFGYLSLSYYCNLSNVQCKCFEFKRTKSFPFSLVLCSLHPTKHENGQSLVSHLFTTIFGIWFWKWFSFSSSQLLAPQPMCRLHSAFDVSYNIKCPISNSNVFLCILYVGKIDLSVVRKQMSGLRVIFINNSLQCLYYMHTPHTHIHILPKIAIQKE